MKRFRDALKKYYNSKDQSCISFERNFKSQHLQIQVPYHTLVQVPYHTLMVCVCVCVGGASSKNP